MNAMALVRTFFEQNFYIVPGVKPGGANRKRSSTAKRSQRKAAKQKIPSEKPRKVPRRKPRSI